MRYVLPTLFLISTLLLATSARAGEGDLEVASDVTVEGLVMGTLDYGVDVSPKDLEGKVVMFALWGG